MNKSKSSASSLLEKPTARSGRTTKRTFNPDRQLPVVAEKRLERLTHLPDEQIDYSDIPPLPETFLQTAIRNPYYRPIKQQITLRLDADVIAWLRKSGKGYQTRLNEILRKEMRRELVESLDDSNIGVKTAPAKVAASHTKSNAIRSEQQIPSTRRKAS